ncbi:hypothetical protein CWC10_00025 [Pseudoalteromonas sp. S3173]|nr:hypothetical protein CWC10_00025 [Pseudoalteromonas sp. S3173]
MRILQLSSFAKKVTKTVKYYATVNNSAQTLGSVDLSRLNLQQPVWYLGKAAPMWCGYSP